MYYKPQHQIMVVYCPLSIVQKLSLSFYKMNMASMHSNFSALD